MRKESLTEVILVFSMSISHQAELDRAVQMEPWFRDRKPSVTVTQSTAIGVSQDAEQRGRVFIVLVQCTPRVLHAGLEVWALSEQHCGVSDLK